MLGVNLREGWTGAVMSGHPYCKPPLPCTSWYSLEKGLQRLPANTPDQPFPIIVDMSRHRIWTKLLGRVWYCNKFKFLPRYKWRRHLVHI